jgi:Ser/Thr protein kinase RdoA (MazF antagonist)
MFRIPRPVHIRQLAVQAVRREGPSLTLDEIKTVLAQYNVREWQAIGAFNGGGSHNVALQTGQGKKLLKRYFWPWPHQETEHSILCYLTDKGFPVPRLHLTRTGLTRVELGDRSFALFDFVDGYCIEDYYWSADRHQQWVAQAAEMLARFHRLMETFAPRGQKPDGFMPGSRRLVRDMAWHLAVVDQYVSTVTQKLSPDELDRFLLRITEQLKRDLADVGRLYESPVAQLPKQLIHADYKPRNVMFDRQGIIAVLDFQAACINLRALDVVRGLTAFSRVNRYEVDDRLAATFLLAYYARQPLTDQEIEAMPDLIRWRHLRNIVWKLDTLETHPRRQSRNAYLAFIRGKWQENIWMKAHGDRLLRNLRQCLEARRHSPVSQSLPFT